MTRDALVVGINGYPELTDLSKPARDAEAVAQLLETYGDFRVRRLPEANINSKLCINPDGVVSGRELQNAIATLFNPDGDDVQVPKTALLFFAGHGLRDVCGGVTEGFLAASNSDPKEELWGVSLKWLRRLLQKSRVTQQIIWLDCCHSGELDNFDEADPGNLGQGKDKCFIAACRPFELAYESLGGEHGVLTQFLLEGLDPRENPEGVITNYTLVDFIIKEKVKVRGIPQEPIHRNSGYPIILTTRNIEQFRTIREGICPYKSLKYFDFTDEDAEYFYGRTERIDELIEKVKTNNFLAVLGPSGCGKSSLVRAGLLYKLKLGQNSSGSDSWKIYPPFTPVEQDKTPLQNLARVFVDAGINLSLIESSVERATQLKKAEDDLISKADDLILAGKEGLKRLVEATQAPRVVLVIDQFEEIFTLCPDDSERHRFFECLLGALEAAEGKLCLILVMRADFLGKCAEKEYFGLTEYINKNQYLVPTLTASELEESIVKPAQKVGLDVESGLVKQMVEDVQGSPGSLPLLQYTLTELWHQKTVTRLTLPEYNRLGGVKGALQKQADLFFKSLSETEQKIAKRIFLELTQLGEGTEDTRRRVLKTELVTTEYSEEAIDNILQKLVKARLVVADELKARGQADNKALTVIDIAHESLIRHWPQLKNWLEENREMLRRKRQIEDQVKHWFEGGKSRQRGDLLAGSRLAVAQDFWKENPAELSPIAVELIQLSQEAETQARLEEMEAQLTLEREIQEKEKAQEKQLILESANQKAKRRIKIGSIFLGVSLILTVAFLGTATIARYQQREAEEGTKLEQAGVSALRQLRSGELEALLSAMQSGQRLQELVKNGRPPQDYPAASPVLALQKILDTIYERNRFDRGGDEVKAATFSPDGQAVATAGRDGVIRIWSLSGTTEAVELRGHKEGVLGGINDISFSPNSQRIVSAGGDGTVRLWERSGQQLMQMEHRTVVNTVTFSPDGKTFASGDDYGVVFLWNQSGGKKAEFEHPGGVNQITFSPNGQTLATAGKDGRVRLWKTSGKEIAQFQAHPQQVFNVSFSPDGQQLATTGDDEAVRLWNLSGKEVQQLEGHQGWVIAVNFSPDGEQLATAGDDGTVRLWERSGREIVRLQGHRGTVWRANFSPDGRYLISAGRDGSSRLWDLSTKATLQFPGHQEDVNTVSFSPDGQEVIGAGDEGIVRVWNLSGKELAKWTANSRGAIWSISHSPNANIIATAGFENTVRLWDRSGTSLGQLRGHESWVNSVEFSPNGQQIVTSGADKTARLWTVSGELVATLEGHEAVVGKVAFSPDGRRIATTDWDGKIKLWDVSGKLQKEWQGHEGQIRSIGFSPDGSQLVTADNNSMVRVWDRSGRQQLEFFSYQSGINAVGFRPDGLYLATGGMDGTVRLWDLQGRQVAEFTNEQGAIWGLKFSADGQSILAGGDMGSLQLWETLELDELLVAGCNWLEGYFVNASESSKVRNFCHE